MNCGVKGCPNKGTAFGVLLLRPKGYTGQPARAVMGLAICPEHQVGKTPESFFTDEGWALIEYGFRKAGRAIPDRASTTLDWEPVQ